MPLTVDRQEAAIWSVDNFLKKWSSLCLINVVSKETKTFVKSCWCLFTGFTLFSCNSDCWLFNSIDYSHLSTFLVNWLFFINFPSLSSNFLWTYLAQLIETLKAFSLVSFFKFPLTSDDNFCEILYLVPNWQQQCGEAGEIHYYLSLDH